MIGIFGIFGVLLLISMFAGYAVVRTLAFDLSYTKRLALIPLTSTSVTALTVAWLHFFRPLGDKGALIGLIPAGIGFCLLLYDAARKRIRIHRGPFLIWAGFTLASIPLVLLPFLIFGQPSSFGIHSNDAIWWAFGDHYVKTAKYLTPASQITSYMALRPLEVSRYGANYLSCMAEALTGFRAWETIQITSALGSFLFIQAIWLLTRRFHVWWPVAAFIALDAFGNNLVFRTLIEALVGFQFGLAFTIAFLAIVLHSSGPSVVRRGLLLGVLLAGVGVFFLEFVPFAGLLSVVALLCLIATAEFDRKMIGALILATVATMIVLGPMTLHAPEHIRRLGGFVIPGVHLLRDDPASTFVHFMGMMELDQHARRIPANWIQWLGAIGMATLIGASIAYARKGRKLMLVIFGVIITVLIQVLLHYMRQDAEYTAHRVLVVMSPFIGGIAFGFIHPAVPRWRLWAALAVVVTACGSWTDRNLLRDLSQSYIVASDPEREIGDRWIPALPPGSKLLIDIEDNLELFYGHHMYFEAVRGGLDEKRIFFLKTRYTYIEGPQREKIPVGEVTHVLRRRNIGTAFGNFEPIASNSRYELLRVTDGKGVGLLSATGGFYGMERGNGTQWLWMNQDGAIVVICGEGWKLEVKGDLVPSPGNGAQTVVATSNGSEVGSWQVPGPISLSTPVPAGVSKIVFHTTGTPKEPGNGDARLMTVNFANVVMKLVPAAR